jgi:hypothetical protein
MRLWWSLVPTDRLFLVMKTPLIMAGGAYLAGASFHSGGLWLTMGLASVIWLLLYGLNESADAACERGLVSAGRYQYWLLGVPLALAASAAWIDPRAAAYLLLMVGAQVAYTLPPFRGKRHWALVVLISGTLNPLLRLQAGAVFGEQAIPLLGYVSLVLLHVGGALRTRLLRKERDLRLGYHTVPDGARYFGAAATILGLLGLGLMGRTGALPILFAIYALLCLPFAIYVWSSRVPDVVVLRKAWLVLAVLALPALLFLAR